MSQTQIIPSACAGDGQEELIHGQEEREGGCTQQATNHIRENTQRERDRETFLPAAVLFDSHSYALQIPLMSQRLCRDKSRPEGH